MGSPKQLLVVCGLPGTGKTTVATMLSEQLEAPLIRTDVVRKDLFTDPEYTSEETAVTYEETLTRSGSAIERDGIAIVDGTFRTSALRETARQRASTSGATFDLVYVTCSQDVVEERIAKRTDDESDADFEIYKHLRSIFESPPESCYQVDNSGSLEETRHQLRVVCEDVTSQAVSSN